MKTYSEDELKKIDSKSFALIRVKGSESDLLLIGEPRQLLRYTLKQLNLLTAFDNHRKQKETELNLKKKSYTEADFKHSVNIGGKVITCNLEANRKDARLVKYMTYDNSNQNIVDFYRQIFEKFLYYSNNNGSLTYRDFLQISTNYGNTNESVATPLENTEEVSNFITSLNLFNTKEAEAAAEAAAAEEKRLAAEAEKTEKEIKAAKAAADKRIKEEAKARAAEAAAEARAEKAAKAKAAIKAAEKAAKAK